jgi:hypothetical protein
MPSSSVPLPGIRECSFLLRLLSACADPEAKAVSFSKFGKRSQRTGLLWCGRHAGITDRAGPVADAKACGYNHGWQFTWAERQGWPASVGHEAGVRALKEVVKLAQNWGIEVLTVFAFSTENWLRPKVLLIKSWSLQEIQGCSNHTLRLC